MTRYRPHNVIREDRADGTVLLRSGYEMSEIAETSSVWLRRWAEARPDTVFLAERSGSGWRDVPYADALEQVENVAAALLARGLAAETPILIVSGNGVDHGVLSLAAHLVGIPTIPVAEQYSLIPGAEKQLQYIAALTRPAMIFAEDGEKFARALTAPGLASLQIVVSRNVPDGATPFADLLKGAPAVDLAVEEAKVGPDSVVKILMTSGSTSDPKGVETTHRMMCANQAMIADALPFLRDRPPRIVDWLPWNHVFGGSHNFNMMLAQGGSLYIDNGKPIKGLVEATIENNRLMNGTMAFNVPVGFAMLRDAMRDDNALREMYFKDLDMLFYAGASLPQDVWSDLHEMAMDVRGDVPLMNSSWGLTETAPAHLVQHEPTELSGVVGVPMTGGTVKLVPDEGARWEVRVKGPNVFERYFKEPDRTAEAFDEEGYFLTGDAMVLLDPDDPNKGLQFDGRISEDFKLMTGIWVRAAALRLALLPALAPLAQDVVITGDGHDEVGVLILPTPDTVADHEVTEDRGVWRGPGLEADIAQRLGAMAAAAKGGSNRIGRALILSEPPSLAEGEITAKGNLNFRKLLTRRAALLDRLYSNDPAVIRV
ncbi:AMP-binding protein [Aestuariivita sp.]|jgi:feruloyl-CoA synthase|uniref:AMP-binding protein n=1 Tax=Aestuariivita sp. TaxID=1872407 RepID=UPI00216DF18A|nr:AMP-binding protein [Aestuariivita sp.]MCE8005426.1 AMP-binding protein [Aestuariivita sp.]